MVELGLILILFSQQAVDLVLVGSLMHNKYHEMIQLLKDVSELPWGIK